MTTRKREGDRETEQKHAEEGERGRRERGKKGEIETHRVVVCAMKARYTFQKHTPNYLPLPFHEFLILTSPNNALKH